MSIRIIDNAVYSGTITVGGNGTFDGNVGIGTTNPSQKLHVSGNARVTGAYYDSNNSAGTSGQVLSSTATGTDWVSLSEISGVDGTGTTNYLAKWSDADTITNSLFIDNGSTIALSTNGGSNTFDLSHTSGGGVALNITKGGNGEALLINKTSGSGNAVSVTGDSYFNGSVGIGTSSPGAKLEVAGASGAISGTGMTYLNNSDDAFSLVINNAGTSSQNDRGVFEARVGASSVFRINNSGNVGIGTTSPGEKLSIEGSGSQSLSIYSTDTGISGTPKTFIKLYGESAAGLQRLQGQISVAPGVNTNSGDMILSTANTAAAITERMRIDGAGNVGIGTTNPTEKLQVDGNIRVEGGAGAGTGNVDVDPLVGAFRINGPGGFRGGLYNDQYITSNPANSINDITTYVAAGSYHITLGNGASQYSNKVLTASGSAVGIGTTTPTETLHVSGSTRIEGALYDSTNSPGTSGQVLSTTATGTQWIASPGAGSVTGTGTTNFLSKFTGTSTLGNSLVFDNGTNVGIGTTSPGYKLSVNGDIHIPQNEYIYFDNTAHYIRRGPSNVELQGFNGLDLRTNGSSRLLINQSGNVGIGTTTPGRKLVVAGAADGIIQSIDTTGAGSHIRMLADVTAQNIINWDKDTSLRFATSDEDWANYSERMRITSSGSVGIGTTSPAEKLHVAGNVYLGPGNQSIRYRTATNWDYYLNATNDDFRIYDSDTTYFLQAVYNGGSTNKYLSLLNTLTVRNNGNVGIGTTSPQGKLNIYSGAAGGGYNSDYDELVLSNSGRAGINILSSATEYSAIIMGGKVDNSTGGIYHNAANNMLSLATQNAFRLNIDNAGNVGIGTTSPNRLLTVAGTTSGLIALNASSYRNTTIGSDSVGNFVVYDDTAGVYRMVINSAGNVGIGTTSPSDKLSVYTGTDYGNNSEYANATIGLGNAAYPVSIRSYRYGGSYLNGLDLYYNNGTPQLGMRIDSTGNVGIGTTAPGAKLDVAGQIRSYAATGQIYSYSTTSTNTATVFAGWTTGTGIQMGYLPNSAQGYIENTYPITGGTVFGDIYFRQNSAGTMVTRMTIKADGGNVGIGTTNPDSKLTVNGSTESISLNTDHFRARYNSTYYTDYSTNGVRFNGTNQTYSFIQNGTNRMSINASGNVGIGTTSPSEKLDVVGNLRLFSGGYPYIDLGISTSNYWRIINDNPNDTFVIGKNGASNFILNPVGAATFSSSVTATNLNLTDAGGGAINNVNGNLFLQTPAGAGWIFRNGPSGYAEYMRLTPSGNLLIGTTADNGYKLDVNGTGRFGADTYKVLSISDAGGAGWGTVGGASIAPQLYMYNTGTNAIVQTYINNTARLEVTNTGITVTGAATFSSSVTATNYYASNGGLFGWGDSSTRIDGDSSNQYIRAVINSSEKLRIAPSGNVGIGTSNPDARFSVVSSSSNSTAAKIGGIEYAGNQRGLTIKTFQSAGGDDCGVEFNAAEGLATYGSFVFKADTAERMRIDSTGNVGIGTTNPGAKLHVGGVTSTQGLYIPGLYTFGQSQSGIEMQLTSTSYNAIRFYQGTDYTGVIHSFGRSWGGGASVGMVNIEGYNGVTIGAWNIPTATFLSSGNVGIGTTNPGAKLHVATDSASGTFRLSPQDGIYEDYRLDIIAKASDVGALTMKLKDNTFLKTYGYYNLTGVSHGVAGYEDLLHLKNNGNVGIGTTNPLAKLYITGANNDTYGQLRVESTGAGADAQITFVTPLNGRGMYVDDSDSNKLKFYTGYGKGSSGREVTFDNDGNVGIGTTSPGYKLHVKDSANIGTIAIGNDLYPGLLYSNASSGEFRIDNRASAGAGYITFYPNGQAGTVGSEAMRILQSGNVGIGTTNPNSQLSLYATTTAYMNFRNATNISSTYGLVIEATNNESEIWNYANGYMRFGTNNSERMRITSSGNIGIGTTNPATQLDVDGEITVSDTANFNGYVIAQAMQQYPNNNDALFAGLTPGTLYHTNGTVKIVI